MSYEYAMVDIETLGNNPRSDFVILSVGAVVFNLDEEDDDIESITDPDRCFRARLVPDEQIRLGRRIEAGTTMWWLGQSEAARTSVTNGPGLKLADFLTQFHEFMARHKVNGLWGNGSSFDNAALRTLWDDVDRTFPLRFWRDLDMRTLTEFYWRLTGEKRPQIEGFEAHTALGDAQRQVLQCQAMWQAINGR